MNQSRRVRISKFLSYVLRHAPESIGRELGPGGWMKIEDLLTGAQQAGRELSRADIERVMRAGDKQRFKLSEDSSSIRARYGHSTSVDLQLEPARPPATLYHGTARRGLESIMTHGLQARGRDLVHLSLEPESARQVGARHGKPVLLQVLARQMHAAGHRFYHPADSIWLTQRVPVEYLKLDVAEQAGG